jgi:hypothetical protein
MRISLWAVATLNGWIALGSLVTGAPPRSDISGVLVAAIGVASTGGAVAAGVLATSTSAFSTFSFEPGPTVEAVTLDNLRGASVLEGAEDLAAYANVYDLRGALRSS